MASKRGRGFQSGHPDRVRPFYIQQKELIRARQASETTRLSPNAYQCECCQGWFEQDNTEEEAREIAKRDYPNDDLSNAVLVCNTCYEAIKQRLGGDMS